MKNLEPVESTFIIRLPSVFTFCATVFIVYVKLHQVAHEVKCINEQLKISIKIDQTQMPQSCKVYTAVHIKSNW